MQIHKGALIQVMKCHKWREWGEVNKGLDLVLGIYVKSCKYKLNNLNYTLQKAINHLRLSNISIP